jgi:histidinol-phosphate aminotransferase
MDLTKLNIKNSIFEISAYQPGESSADSVKLSANENPLGCSEKVKLALKELNSLNRYPDGNATALKEKIIEYLGNFNIGNIVCGVRF